MKKTFRLSTLSYTFNKRASTNNNFRMIEENIVKIENASESGLNPPQLEAVNHIDGPLLILAGAGTGKTKVLTQKIAHLIGNGKALPSQILAVTFTNKAASEMKERVVSLIGEGTEYMNIGTFHSICAKILRQYATFLGFTPDYTIVNYDDQLRVIKRILKEKNVAEDTHPAKLMLYKIGRFKDKAYMPHKVPQSLDSQVGPTSASEVYRAYQAELRTLNAMDFGDLLLYCIELFNSNLQILETFQHRFKYVLVDEYQDTNVTQYLWLRMLVQEHNNLCCVGDDDQSIYGWRGAEIDNILRFPKDFKDPPAKIVRLEQNYRSTKNILKAASGIISANDSRHPKQLWTDAKEGEPIKLHQCYDDKEEARFVADEIETLRRYKKISFKESAILLRAGYQTRAFEESLNFLQIPYNVVGGTKFYERLEIKDALAYVRFLVNPQDLLAFERLIGTPKRGIGQVSVQKLILAAQEDSQPFVNVARSLIQSGLIKGKGAASMLHILNQFEEWRSQLEYIPHSKVVDKMLNESGYIQMYQSEATEESKERLDNIKELLRNLAEYNSLKEYLEHISLVMDNDSINTEDRVNIMTIHAAKGLEFNTVFLCGWEEGIFPSQKAIEEGGKKSLEEERRLAYVAITRAMERLYITCASNRRIYGSYQSAFPSRFIEELPKDTYEIVNHYASYNSGKTAFSTENGYRKKLQNMANKGATSSTDTTGKIKCGQRVSHPKFGKGTVVSITNEQAVVVFEKLGIKRLLAEYLTIL